MLIHLAPSAVSARRARAAVQAVATDAGREDLVDDATLVVSELVANAVLHARTDIVLVADVGPDGLHVEVTDGSSILPHWSPSLASATSGRGLLLVERLCTQWGVVRRAQGGKTVWAHLEQAAVVLDDCTVEELLEQWTQAPHDAVPDTAVIAVPLDVDVPVMLESRAHTGDLLRQLQLSLVQDSTDDTAQVPAPVLHLAHRLSAATEAFHDARQQIWSGTLRAAQRGLTHVTLDLRLHPADADAAREWLWALDEADAMAAAGLLYLPPFPAPLTDYRRSYIYELADQVDAAVNRTGPTPADVSDHQAARPGPR